MLLDVLGVGRLVDVWNIEETSGGSRFSKTLLVVFLVFVSVRERGD